MSRLLIIMGSGETAPTMVKPHRAIFERVGAGPAVLIDTTYGFQSNADDISTRAVGYFAASVGRDVGIVSWRGRDVAGVRRERALGALREARWIFAGPGSPTFALRQWSDTPVPGILTDLLLRGAGAVVFASAAALTLGSHTVPVYEIYKAGLDPEWSPGLDIVRAVTGLPAVIIPHYDNAEGGHHDTRFCYLGEARLALMEQALPADAFVLGVDEHTAVVMDLDARTATVTGNGTMTIRVRGHSVVHPTGAVVPFDALTSGVADAPLAPPEPEVAADLTAPLASLRADEDRIAAQFTAALEADDVDTCVEAILELEQVLLDWSADTLTSDEGDHARATLRQMVVKLGDLARPDPASGTAIEPVMAVLLSIRARVRESRDFAMSDAIRDRLAAIGIEIRDTPEGSIWQRPSPRRGSPDTGAGGPDRSGPPAGKDAGDNPQTMNI